VTFFLLYLILMIACFWGLMFNGLDGSFDCLKAKFSNNRFLLFIVLVFH
jgi:hypothetical protein